MPNPNSPDPTKNDIKILDREFLGTIETDALLKIIKKNGRHISQESQESLARNCA